MYCDQCFVPFFVKGVHFSLTVVSVTGEAFSSVRGGNSSVTVFSGMEGALRSSLCRFLVVEDRFDSSVICGIRGILRSVFCALSLKWERFSMTVPCGKLRIVGPSVFRILSVTGDSFEFTVAFGI